MEKKKIKRSAEAAKSKSEKNTGKKPPSQKNIRGDFGDLDFTDAENGKGNGHVTPHPKIAWPPVLVQVSNGDLMYAKYPVLAGHFMNDGIFSVEKAIDWHLKGELSRRLQMGLYPGEIGTYELILLSEKEHFFPGTIILGLGRQGVLTAFMLSQSVEQAIAKFLTLFNAFSNQHEAARQNESGIGISSPAIGSGYGGLTIESSIRAIIQGVQNANQKIKKVYGDHAKIVQLIEFTELFEDKALDYVYTIDRILNDQNSRLHFVFPEKKINRRAGARKRLPFDDTSDWWTRIEVELDDDLSGGNETIRGLCYKVSTDAARQEERTVLINFNTIQSMLEDLSTEHKWTDALAKTIFEMLIPNEFKDMLRKQNNILLLLNKETAAFPWELLQDRIGDVKPLSINAGMIRQLATADYRLKINPVLSRTALVVADPDLKDTFTQLGGAALEGEEVIRLLEENNYATLPLVKKGAGEILVSLLSKDYKIIHFAGHGVFNTDPLKPTGMLIGPDAYLTPAIINQMSNVPELVFVNCCFLGAGNIAAEVLMQSRHKLAANIGTQLIDIGVKAVVVAGWAIEDESALIFATEFYRQMFDGEQFGVAVRKSREKTYDYDHVSGNTWGAFHCYGDPFYTLEGQLKNSRNTRQEFVVEREAEIELYNLLSKQDTGQYDPDFINTELDKILDKIKRSALQSPVITEWIAKLYYSLNKYPEAITKYSSLLQENNTEFTLGALEQLCNIRAKQCIRDWKKNGKKSECHKSMLQVIKDLELLLQISETVERLAIMGSAYKRLALLQDDKEKGKAYHAAAAKYYKANSMCQPGNRHYTLTNWLLIDSLLSGIDKGVEGMGYEVPDTPQALKVLDEELKIFKENASAEMHFWDLIAEPGILLTKFILGDESVTVGQLSEINKRVWGEIGSTGDKESLLEHFECIKDLLNYVIIHKNDQETKLKKILSGIDRLSREIDALQPG